MQRDKFYKEMLDYTMALFCAFNPFAPNQAGMILFRQNIGVSIPLARYSRTEWETKVNTVRTNPSSCCSCCTPLADAFELASVEFARGGVNPEKIAFVITDGVPVNNLNGGAAKWRFHANTGLYNPAQYKFSDVNEQAEILKQRGIRVFLVGIPSNTGRPPAMDYFRGIPSNADRDPKSSNPNRQCVERNGKYYCYNWNPRPIVSQPIDKNSFSSNTFDVNALLESTVTALCFVVPTKSPTIAPTAGVSFCIG